jgi:hypothetical protein
LQFLVYRTGVKERCCTAQEGETMTELIREIEKKAKQLSVEERELLAERLLATVSDAPLTEIEEIWVEQAERRYSAWKAGRTKAIEAERALADIRGELRQ